MEPSNDAPKWVKSSLSYANGNCAEVAWLRSGLCESGGCVEVAPLRHDSGDGGWTLIGVRNSRYPEGPVLKFTPDEWHAFIAGAKAGEFDGFG